MSLIHDHNHSNRVRKKSTWHKSLKPLWKDIKHGHHKQLEKLLSNHGESLKDLDPEGTVLMHAVIENHLEMVELLLENHTVIYCDKESGLSPLHYAIKCNKTKLLDIFIKYNTSLDKPTLYDKRTPLHMAVYQKNEDLVLMLLMNGASPDTQDIYGCTPLHNAVYFGFENITVLLLKYDANVNIADNEGWRALHHGAASDHAHIIKLLLQYNANSNVQNKYGKTALHIACEKNNLTSVEVLSSSDVSTTICDVHGKMAHEYAKNEVIRSMVLSPKKQSDTEIQHIDMQIRSQSLIDLLDEQYLKDHYYSDEPGATQHTAHRKLQQNQQTNHKISLASLVNQLLQKRHKKQHKQSHHENLAVCQSVPEIGNSHTEHKNTTVVDKFNGDHFIHEIPTIVVHASQTPELTPVQERKFELFEDNLDKTSQELTPTEQHKQSSDILDTTTVPADVTHKTPDRSPIRERKQPVYTRTLLDTSLELEGNNVDTINSLLELKKIENVSKDIETCEENNHITTDTGNSTDSVELHETRDHLDSCITSISHVLHVVNGIEESKPMDSESLQSLKTYLQEWAEKTKKLRDAFTLKQEHVITKM